MRNLQVTHNIPNDYCNTCPFYSTWLPDPEQCMGFGRFRQYRCSHFDTNLAPDWQKTHRHKKDMLDEEEKKVPVPDFCKVSDLNG